MMTVSTSIVLASNPGDPYFFPIPDEDVPEHMKEMVARWRKLAKDHSYNGPICWKVLGGFTLKDHAPLAGPCKDAFRYLQKWNLKSDEPTKSAHVFFIPRLIVYSTNRNVDEQMAFMAKMRNRYGLPEHHLSNFGSAAMLTGLILAHFKRTTEKIPINSFWVRSDTFHESGSRLDFGNFGEGGLDCAHYLWDDYRLDNFGAFPLGVELD